MQGLILIDKPQGLTSFGVVAQIRRLAGTKKVGHTGTLDPMATGVLPVFIGRATQLSSFLLDADKTYVASFRFGITTDTCDITGEITDEKPVNISEEDILKVLPEFTGKITQTPPMFSALKKDGVPLYKLARQGVEVEIPQRDITVYSIVAQSEFKNNEMTFEISCSKGTYIRSLCRDIGQRLGCGAALSALRRTATSGFNISECVSLEALTEDNLQRYLINEEKAIEHLREINVSRAQAIRFANGGRLDINRVGLKNTYDNEVLRIRHNGTLVGLGNVMLENGEIAIKCIINKPTETALALGTFDGIHLGHQAVLNSALKKSDRAVAVSFSLPPKTYFGTAFGALMSEREKEDALYKMGFSDVHFLNFEQVRNLSAIQFLNWLKAEFNPTRICCGFNYQFGSGAKGNTELLRDFCKTNGIELVVCEPVKRQGEIVSSSAIRALLEQGEIKKANSLCFLPFGFSSEIIHGDMRGRTIGYPTINQRYPEKLCRVKFGVYKSQVTVNKKSYTGITNIGIRPTFQNGMVSAETYILDFDGDIYGEKADLRILEFIRPEQKFEGINELQAAIENDISKIK